MREIVNVLARRTLCTGRILGHSEGAFMKTKLPLHLELNLPDGRGVLSLLSERPDWQPVDVPFRLD